MSEISNQKKFRVTRWKQLIFPKELIIDECSVLTRKRKFPAFWIVREESIPLRSVASIQISRGLLFSSLLIENSGGPYPIQISGIPNKYVASIRRCIESYEPPEVASQLATDEIVEIEESLPVDEPKSNKRPIFNPFKNLKVSKKKTYMQFDEPDDDSFDEPDDDSIENSQDTIEFEPLNLDDTDFTEEPIMEIDVRRRIEKDEIKSDDDLPSIDEALDEYAKNKSSSLGWVKEIMTPPTHSYRK